ncbi:MAG: amidohydrolase family protein [Gammaproteobacteria bacterium]
MRKFHALLPIAALFAATEITAQVAPVPPPPPAPPVILLTAHALDGHGGTLRNARIGVAGGRITTLDARPEGAVIDLRGYTVMPGWIDTHVHLAMHFDRTGRIATETELPLEAAMGIAGAAWDTLMGGFTTVQSVGDPGEKPLRDAIRDHGFPGPRVLTSLAPIEGDSKTTREELIAAVHSRKEQGADLIKIFASLSERVGALPTFTEEQLRILCDEARAVGLRSMVHAYRSQVGAAARAGCREIEHATYTTQADIDAAVAAGAFISPQVGLVVQNYLANKARYLGVGNYTEQGMAMMDHDLHFDFEACTMAVHTPNAKVVFSTDATAGAHGHNAEEFLGRVQHCGQTPMAALVSANAVAAEALDMADKLGKLAPGYEADIIALDGDPLKDLTAVRRVVFVMRGGVVYKWAGVAASRVPAH